MSYEHEQVYRSNQFRDAYHGGVPARDDEVGEYEFGSLLAQSCRDEVPQMKQSELRQMSSLRDIYSQWITAKRVSKIVELLSYLSFSPTPT
jgi:hypothetical protein